MKQTEFSSILRKYVTGFVAAIALSFISYTVATGSAVSSPGATMAVLLVLAAIQLAIQLICFLHLGANDRSRDRTITLLFTLTMMLVIVIGSLWIMKNLDYRMGMSPEAMNEYMLKQNKKGF